jgi:hypothetical protein
LGSRKGRKPTWGTRRYAEWQALRAQPAFKALETIASQGLEKVDPADLAPLVSAAPTLSAKHASPSAVKKEIIEAAVRLNDPARSQAVLVLLRETHESHPMPVASAHRLARVTLGEADGHVDALASKLHRAPTQLELMDKIPADCSNFRRIPKKDRAPGKLFELLRDLYEELVPTPVDKPSTTDVEAHSEGATIPADTTYDASDPQAPISTRWRGKTPTVRDLAAIGRVVRKHYKTELDLTRFARAVLTPHDVIENLTIDVTLTDDGQDWYRFNVTRTFSARFIHYTAGVVLGDHARATLMRCIPELKELIWLPPETRDLDATVTELIKDGLLETRESTSSTGYRCAGFQPLADDHEFVKRLTLDGSLDPSTYRLLGVEITGSAELVGYRSTLHMPLARSRRRCAWFADGPVFVEKINIDLTDFTDAAESDHANVYFFLPGTDSYSRDAERGSKKFERTVRDWILRHHGFMIHW